MNTSGKRFVVGLTGGIGSGKSTAAGLFEKLGVEVVDADVVAREVVEPGSAALSAIADHFGPDILDSEGALKRAELRQIVFAKPAEKDWLEGLLHPLIRQSVQDQLAQCFSEYCLFVSPLLLETDQHQLVDRLLIVDIDPQAQLNRTLARDDSDEETIKAIIAAQIDRESRLQKADDILDNGQDLESLWSAVTALHQKYLELAREHND